MAVTVYPAPTPAGTNNIGDVDVLTVPALVAGTANIGDVDVLSLPALPAGSNNIGDVDVLTLPALPAGTNVIGGVDGDVAHDGVDAGDPVKIGGKANTSAPTAVAAADRVNAWFGLRGQLVITQQRDIGRENLTLIWDQVATVTSESALANFTSGVRAGGALGAANQYTVQAGKVLRIVAVNGALRIGGTSPVAVLSKLRIRQAASVANTSPIIWQGEIGAPATANEARHVSWTIPEGIEVAAGQQITFTHIETNAGGTSTPGVSCTILGYEYAV